MYRKSLSFLLFLLIISLSTVFIPTTSFAFSGNGSGSSGDAYQITTCAQIMEMANNVSASYTQKNDINCSGITYSAVGTSGSPFTGVFDGGNYAISQLTISGSSGGDGLFGYVSGATIKNVRLVSGSISDTGNYVGSLIGHAGSGTTVIHSSSQMTVTAGTNGGGLIGYSTDSLTVSKSFYNGTFTATDTSGGLIGAVYGISNTISDCYASGSFTDTNHANLGGLIGYLYTSGSAAISNCYSTMSMNIDISTNVGGLIGVDFTGTVSNSFAASAVSGTGTNHGGVFGAGFTSASNIYLDVYTAGQGCLGAGTSTCTQVNSGNVTPNYFKGNSINPPFNSWDFTNTWQTVNGGYPVLQGFTSPPLVSSLSGNTSSGNSSPPSCTDASPTNSPNLFQMTSVGTSATLYFVPVSGPNNKYFISYGFDKNAEGFGTEFAYLDRSGVIPYTVNALFPGTWYFKVRGGNGCMPGDWSQVLSVKIGFGLTSSVVTPKKVLGLSSTASLSNGKCTSYTVKSGDSLWRIASDHLGNGSLFSDIEHQNNLQSSLIHTGQTLKIGC